MTRDSDGNWWTFTIDKDVRADNVKSRFTGEMDVNPELPGGFHRLDYHDYLGLDRLLACQRPSSRIPDERAFIVTHQLMEIVFKLVVFDLAVVAATLQDVSSSDQTAAAVIEGRGADDAWRPALTAAARISFACRELLPSTMRILSDPSDADETFNSIEFHRFRQNLEPASGFQSAQFRLIQRALGKANLLSVRLFPARTYRQFYGDVAGDTVRVDDPVILREDSTVASPSPGDPLERVARLEESANAALEQVARVAGASPDASGPDVIDDQDVKRAVTLLERILSRGRGGARTTGSASAVQFAEDLSAAAARENARRNGLQLARAGAHILRKRAPASPLHDILSRLSAADEALHGTAHDSFLSVHLRVTRERLRQIRAYAAKSGEPEPSIGTGGGGIEYLGWSQRYLIPLFPALVAFRELGD
ncbi:MAG TPA: tryptophan 2,3-dioxygenase family protein [Candidatus Eremiobacteraceae bacterium]|nr:tryptophan 2,3-dioxygenase family protein [Candidatus Eremiobacteraceae bacterium]